MGKSENQSKFTAITVIYSELMQRNAIINLF
jgi:hypothetical protein